MGKTNLGAEIKRYRTQVVERRTSRIHPVFGPLIPIAAVPGRVGEASESADGDGDQCLS